MGYKHFLLVCAIMCAYYVTVTAQVSGVRIPLTRFTCRGRASGYYADIETGCQVYHMCDGLGRQFSYSCPNTTLFQQRMLICDHWYMVNCSKAESDYSANLLIGQRDKPFVSEEEMRLRTPRPDILSVPPNNNYYDGLKQAESKFPIHPGNSIVGVADTITTSNDLDSGKNNYRPPTSWSTGTGVNGQSRPDSSSNQDKAQDIAGAASDNITPTFNTPTNSFGPSTERFFRSTDRPRIPTPSQDLSPPKSPSTTTEQPSSEEFDLDVRMKESSEDPVYNFIKRFDPNSPDSIKTAMSKSEIINLNQHLPAGQVSAEEERTPRKNENNDAFNTVHGNNDKKSMTASRFDTVNLKPSPTTPSTQFTTEPTTNIPTPHRELVPPKEEYLQEPSTTVGPPIYYEWKWAVPAFDLEPPKQNNETSTEKPKGKVQGRSPFSSVTRPSPVTVDPTPSNVEYNTSSYFVPDYVFPLDNPHPGYEGENSQTSFQVKISQSNFGENPNCPQCHPAYLKPGTCEPCIVKR
ncbi:mucin-2 [Plodia interpunctella]|uniref:mucin-2 n=1 Tax=Plodia interpunctella TaxID=58824 RepID=UPI002367D712|nr:uncharacterized protein LOC128671754 [Plodia interpunctella]XP_053604468.1 uncharacterized protein LOC128671754 [Plodia interpunctella]XP_053604469.1 uncharacterized protein LOC128671754 [Plodia interpunctella]